MEHEEVMQEAYIIYLRCITKYTEVTEPKHFVALFKTSWHNQFTDMAYKSSSSSCEISSDVEESQVEIAGDLDTSGYLSILLHQAPSEIKQVFLLFLSAPTEIYELFSDVHQRKENKYKNRNRVINRMLGFEKDRDIMSEVVSYFS